MDVPRNRKQRRAAAAAAGSSNAFDASSVPLARPPQNNPSNTKINGKTLVDIISERQAELLQGHTGSPDSKRGIETKYMMVDPVTGDMSPFDSSGLGTLNGNSHASSDNASSEEASRPEEPRAENDAPIPPFIDTLLLSIPLTALHLTLAYLAAHQYAQSIDMNLLVRESGFITFPMLTLLIHLSHGHIISFNRGQTKTTEVISLFPWHADKLSISFLRKLLFPPSLRTTVFLPAAVILGGRLMIMTNEDPYYAVMKRAPAIGTLWVWSILEIPAGAAALGALLPMVWGVWWKGYGII